MNDDTGAIRKDFLDIMMKGGEFFQCAKHAHARGMSEVAKEVAEMVKVQKDKGIAFSEFEAEIKLFVGELPSDDDKFWKMIKDSWE